MTEAEFRSKRRQQFLTEKYFRLNRSSNEMLLAENRKIDTSGLTPADVAYPAVFESSFKNQLKLLRLHYTAGEAVEHLKPLYTDASKWFAAWHTAEVEYSRNLASKTGRDLRLDMTPIELGDLSYFQLTVDLLSLGILLGEADTIRHAAKLMTSARGSDMLLETLLEPVVADPDTEVSEFFHEQPYGALLDAVYTADSSHQASAFVKQYLEGWYKAFEGVPWHNGHLVLTDEYSNYEGYWAFEAAAICVIHDIDDTSFRDHMVYPKDLADWARANDVVAKLKPGGGPSGTAMAAPLRCEGNQPCPREGYWFTPAKAGSRRFFKQGELMPDLKSDYGRTIWQWDVNQSA